MATQSFTENSLYFSSPLFKIKRVICKHKELTGWYDAMPVRLSVACESWNQNNYIHKTTI